MDYEKKLALAKEALDSGSYDKETIEYIFPELKESEDERIRNALLNFLNKELKYHGDAHWDYEVLTTEIVSWLNKIEVNTNCNESKQDICVNDPVISFVNVQGEQKPDWSEEDETRLTNNIIMLKEGASLHFNKKDITKTIDWLKSLKERYTWKPSDEQMDVLLSEVTAWTKGCPKQIVLESLYQDLQKLREK